MSGSERLRIALFTYAVQPRGGVLHALTLAEALHAAGHTAVLHALDSTGRGFVREPRCPYVLVPAPAPRADTLAYVRSGIAAYVAAWNSAAAPFDAYHAHDGISGNALATLAERGDISGFVRTVHHLDDFGATELAALQARSVERAGALFAVSRVWGERLSQRFGRAVTVVPNGVDGRRFAPADAARRTALRARYGAASGPLFATIGGIESRKNTLATLEAFARVRTAVPAARLVIAGGASVFSHTAYRRAFERRAAQLGLAGDPALTVTGVVADAEIVALLQAADALVFPSLVEGFGLVVLEGLACGTPVVTSAIPPFTEYLDPADALLVDPNDPAAIAAAMLRACDPAVAATLRARGRAVAARWTWTASATAHERAYRAFLAGPDAAAGSERACA